MRTILCYGDSNTYGLSPEWVIGNPGRHPRDKRWTGLLQKKLGEDYCIIEEGLNGRTTVFDDPTVPGRRGLDFIVPCIETHNPVDLLIVNLGGNDSKRLFSAQASDISAGLSLLIRTVRNPDAYLVYGPPSNILICSPTAIGEASLHSGDGIADTAMLDKVQHLPKYFRAVAEQFGCHFLDLSHIEPSVLDGVHLDTEGHRLVASAVANKVAEIFSAG